VRKSTILLHVGKRSLTELFHQEENYQWPILQEIDNPDLPLYRDADKTLLDEFMRTIENEKTLREQKKHMERVKYWSSLLEIIETRAELYMSIFNFCKKDETHCEAVAERYKRIGDRRTKKRRTAWGIGIGAGAAAGAAALWYMTKKEKKP
jgi:cobalamin biosynthesis protein CbiD